MSEQALTNTAEDNKNPVVDEVFNIFSNVWNKQVILYGPPGTSKTYSAIIIAANMLDYSGKNYEEASKHLENCKNFKLVQFHPSYSYEDFVRGITVKPDSQDKSKIEYKTESKIFETFCLQKGKKVLIIDEINRAPLASVLGELIYGLEYRNKEITTPYELEDKKPLVVPDDLYIIGTMNTADRSIGSIDYAVRRRFSFVQVGSSPEIIEGSWSSIGKKASLLYNRMMDEENGLFSEDLLADPEIDVDDIKIGHTYFLGLKKEIASGEKKEEDENGYLEYRIKYQIKPIYMEYIKDGIINPSGKERFETIVDTWRAESEKPRFFNLKNCKKSITN